MDNKVPPNFSSENPDVQYFIYFPVPKWNFESSEKHMMEEKRRTLKLAAVFTKYKYCLNTLAIFSDLSKDKKLIVNKLI